MAKTQQMTEWTGTEKDYRKFADKVHNVKSEIKDLNKDIKQIMHDAIKAGCNPRVLKAVIKLDEMHEAEKDALQDALEI